jgi:ATP-binding cassette, subfamily B (MDR/TAP), member 1
MAVSAFGLAFYLSWKLTLTILAGIPIVIILLPVFSSRVQSNIVSQSDKLGLAAKLASNVFTAIETVKFYNGEGLELFKYTAVITEACGFFFRQAFWNAIQTGILRVVTLSMFVQGFWFGNILLDKGQITAAKILTSFWAAILAVQAMMQIMPQLIMLERGRVAAQILRATIFSLNKTPLEYDSMSSKRPAAVVGDITFEKVRDDV